MTSQPQGFELDTSAAWRRARRSMNRLFEDLADLKEAGGAASLADSECWAGRQVARAVEDINLVRRMLRDEVALLLGTPPGAGDQMGY